MNVREVGVLMTHRLMFVNMGVGFDTIPICTMLVLVMLIMRVRMDVASRHVFMLMNVPFRNVKQDTCRHQQCRRYQRRSQRLVLRSHSEQRTEKRRH